jgi:hypothetical protein
MAVWAEFEEKEFETLANASFIIDQVKRGSSVRLFSPGQVLEAQIGFDFATRVDPRGPLYRLLFGSVAGAPGVPERLYAPHQIPISVPTRMLNVFLQYKRPESFASGHRSKVWPKPHPHLGFMVRESPKDPALRYRQVGLLSDLESSLAGLAKVSYACPSVWRKQDLYERFSNQTLLASSVFVRPSQLARVGLPAFHDRWTFDPADISRGIPNPDGQFTKAINGDAFLSELEVEVERNQTPSPMSDWIVGASQRTEDVRALSRESRSRMTGRDRRRFEIEESKAYGELSSFRGEEKSVVSASLDLAVTARSLGLGWMIARAR